ncbi:unnamed protein product, partial [Mesorhabditis spiculigera]
MQFRLLICFSLIETTLGIATTDGCINVYPPQPAGCQDAINPRTGVSDCSARKNLCNDPMYYTVMTKNCPRTCNRCTISTCFDQINPRTRQSECGSKVAMCKQAGYQKLMREQCPVTCGYCKRPPTSQLARQAPLVKTQAVCQDLMGECRFRAACGYCITYRDMMYIFCGKSCGFCI